MNHLKIEIENHKLKITFFDDIDQPEGSSKNEFFIEGLGLQTLDRLMMSLESIKRNPDIAKLITSNQHKLIISESITS